VIGPGQGATVWLGGCGVVLKVSGEETGGAFSIVEHPVLPGTLIPPHVHYDEDELSFVVEGTFGVKIGDRLLEAGAGSYVFKPKGIPHTFWNASAETARLVEVIWPSGFERFFKELGAAFQQAGGPPGPEMIRGLSDRYHCPYLMDWVPELQARYGVSVLHGGGQRPGENVPPER
jgi:mannose-6-phosphate isomerase-like protein (cupin superfamily)